MKQLGAKETEKHNSTNHQFHGMQADAKALKITGWLTGIYFIIISFILTCMLQLQDYVYINRT